MALESITSEADSIEIDCDLLRALTSDLELAEAYETLLSGLELVAAAQPLKTLLVTSTQPDEGKTTVAAALGLTMALAGRSVRVLDADLRRPAVHKALGIDNSLGLSDFLTGRAELGKVEQTLEGALSTPLSVIPSGPVNREAIHKLASPDTREALLTAAAGFDFTLIDSAPALAVDDAAFLASVADGILFVVGTGSVRRDQARRARNKLEEAGGRIVGVAMNRFDPARYGSGSHPYRAYGYSSAT